MNTDLKPGLEPVAGYTLIDRLGKGGFGEVWKATGPGGFPVALKFVALDENAGPVELRALDVIRHIRHPHLLGTFGSWQVDDSLIIAMELADKTLLDRFREAVGQGFPGIPAPEIFEHFLDAAKALDFLNEPRHPAGGTGLQGIQHRDVKPQNLLLVGGSVKVADFGLARVLEHSSTGHTGSMTPSYAAPEFFDRKTSSQSDQYSLAVTYCHLRGGRLPFEGHPAAVMAGHMMREPDLSMIPENERLAVARAMAKSPRDRWPSCRAFVQAVMGPVADSHAPPTVAPDNSTNWKQTTHLDPGTTAPLPVKPKPEPDSDSELGTGMVEEPSITRWVLLAGATVLGIGLSLLIGWFVASSQPSGDVSKPVVVQRPPAPNPPPAAPSPPKDSTASRMHVEKGLELLRKEMLEQAITEFDQAIQLDPTEASAFAGRAFARGLTSTGPGRSGTPLKKQSPQAAALRESNRQKAKEDCDEAMRLDPTLSLTYAARSLALTLESPPDFTQALAACDEAIRLDGNSAFAYLARAQIFFRRALQDRSNSPEDRTKYLKVAQKTSNRAIGLDSKLVAAYLLRGRARQMTENEEGALEDFEAATRLDPDNAQAFFLAGGIWQKKEENDRAIHYYSEAIRCDPETIMAYHRRAQVYEAKGDKGRAEADRLKAARISVKNEKP